MAARKREKYMYLEMQQVDGRWRKPVLLKHLQKQSLNVSVI